MICVQVTFTITSNMTLSNTMDNVETHLLSDWGMLEAHLSISISSSYFSSPSQNYDHQDLHLRR